MRVQVADEEEEGHGSPGTAKGGADDGKQVSHAEGREEGQGRGHAVYPKCVGRFRRQHPGQQEGSRPQDQQDMGRMSEGTEHVGPPCHEQKGRHHVDHRPPRDVMTPVWVPHVEEHAQVLAHIPLQGLPGVTGEQGVEDADSSAAFQEELRVVEIRVCQRRVEDQEEEVEHPHIEPKSPPDRWQRRKGVLLPSRPKLHVKEEEEGERYQRAGRLVRVLAKAQRDATGHPISPVIGAQSTPQEPEHRHIPEHGQGVRVPPATHVHGPAHGGPNEPSDEGIRLFHDFAGQEVDHSPGQDAHEEVGEFHGQISRPQESVEGGDIIVIKPGNFEAGDIPGMGASALYDFQGLLCDVCFVQPQPGRYCGDAVNAQRRGDCKDQKQPRPHGPSPPTIPGEGSTSRAKSEEQQPPQEKGPRTP